ncbi:putative bifunctional diguanylate cyclase/phosphodiesterase [Pseudophaeobacter sp. A-200-2]|uniref:putative bifunctional diguanylate cyclase/phosphodiesterase n=1 Tax=Pseudophaeobacter sp. A-200-2 TaxID=3098145 RepID=UPI0034D71366
MSSFFARLKDYWVYLLICAGTMVTFVISVEIDAFDTFYEYSRAHEDWELDEIAILVLNLAFGSFVALIVRSRQLARVAGERDRAEKEAQQFAWHDPLTGLPNRRAFVDHLATLDSADGASGGVVLMLDLDRFKAVNDIHGHAYGDLVLMECAARLRAELTADDLVARLGGDEFAIALAPETTATRAESVARRLLTAISQPILVDGIRLSVGTSVGLALLTPRHKASDALQYADQALYSAKKGGRGQFAWFDAELEHEARERRALELDLKEAVANDEIAPFFQPVFDIATDRLRGFEVLARWTHATRGVVPPDLFIEIAEDVGLIAPLGWSVLRQACLVARSWDPRVRLAVNVSPTQFRDGHLVERMKEVFEETGFDPRRLEIELTETAIMSDFAMAQSTLRQLHALGVTVALDDFGAGFSSLSNLRQLPFDSIKIDGSFISDIKDRPENQRIVSGILALAHGLDLKVTAEGVETDADFDFLQSVKCEMGQGYHFARPMSGEDVAWMLETKWSSLRRMRSNSDPEQGRFSKAG